MKARQWYRFQNLASDPTVAEIHIIDIIGDWVDELINEYYGMTATVTAKAFVDQLAQLPDAVSTIKVHINSPGGDVFAALNISNALREQQTSKNRTVETIVDGLAASAASIIMMAGKKVTIADNAMVMVHNPWSGAVGNSAEMRKVADTLDAIRNTIVATYKWHSPMENGAIVALMDAETWMDADTALANGFATDKIDGLKAAASIDRRAVATMKVPDRFKARVDALVKPAEQAPSAADPKAIAKACKDAGFPGMTEDLIGLPLDQVTARLGAAKIEKATTEACATEIRAICKTGKQDRLADAFIAGGMSVDGVRQVVTNVAALLDKVEIDNKLDPSSGTSGSAKAKADLDDAYGKLNTKR